MIHKRKDFAKLCGITPRELSVYVSREKVILTKDKKVDDEHPDNAEFLRSRQDKGMVIEVKEKNTKQSRTSKDRDEHLQEVSKLNRRKRVLENEELEEKITTLRLKKEKLEGIVIPTSIVRELFSQHCRSITIEFQQGAENLILEISKKKSYPVKSRHR